MRVSLMLQICAGDLARPAKDVQTRIHVKDLGR